MDAAWTAESSIRGVGRVREAKGDLVESVVPDVVSGGVPFWVRELLHELSQPLMALECQLYLAELDMENDGADDPRRALVTSGAAECMRLMALLRGAQARVAMADGVGSKATQEDLSR